MEIGLSGATAILHFIAAMIALRLIKITGHYTAWILISTGIALAAFRRAVTFFKLLSEDLPYIDLLDVSTAFAISLFFLGGVIMITPLLASLKESEKYMKRENDTLAEENTISNKLVDLKEALTNVKTLSGMLPICASCKTIRDDAATRNR
jgi:multisubunit Na+/H+ antiporter MnhB subunit